jgi:hypothetical protein
MTSGSRSGCGACLVSRNLWHSYGRFTLASLFRNARPGSLALAREYVDYGPRWRGHFVAVQSHEDLDGELRAWLQEAHDTVGVQDDLVGRRRVSRG